MDEISDSEKPFVEIFKRLTAEEFMEDPTRILSLMMDFGFDSRQVKILRMVMSEDMKEVREFLECTVDSEEEIVGNISEYCLVSRKALTDMLDGIKSSMYGGIETRIIDDKKYGRCLISADGVATYSLDMTILHRVTSVDSFTIPDSVTEIGRLAFCDCTHTSIKVSKSNRYYSSNSGALFDKDRHTLLSGYSLVHNGKCMIPGCVKMIEEFAFDRCTSLKEIVIPDSVTEIGDFAFDGCTSLKEAIILESVKKIGERAFSKCTLLNEVVIPDSVTEIGDFAFDRCTSLKEVIIPNSVAKIGKCAFRNCTHAYFKVSEDNRIYSSDSGALFDKDRHTLLSDYSLVHNGKCVIPRCVKKIGSLAFRNSSPLCEIVIPNSVTEIEDEAFQNYKSLREVRIPSSVRKIGNNAFDDHISILYEKERYEGPE